LNKWEEKKARCNIVTADPQGNQKDKEFEVRVITRDKAKTGMDFEHGVNTSKRTKGNIRKVA
jgi:hypothetical protein